MRKLAEVEEAKALMSEAKDWSVMRWLREKKRVREAADKANDALDALNRETKASWSEELKAAYKGNTADPQVERFVKDVKRADEEARRARQDAEDTFDEAERQLSAAMAREGCRKAIYSWELHEKAIRKAEGAGTLK